MTTPSPEERPEPPEVTKCDLCERSCENKNWAQMPWDFDHTTIQLYSGTYGQPQQDQTLQFNLCPDCFRHKLRSWIYATRTPLPSGETGGREEHNPDGLTPEQYGAPEFRLLTKDEYGKGFEHEIRGVIERWIPSSWVPFCSSWFPHVTYRRRVTPPTATVAPGEASPSDKDAEKPACNCSGGDDGAWGLASHTSNCATTVARLRRFHVGHQVASGKGEVICMTCHMELLSTQDDALADARYELSTLRSTNRDLLSLVDTLAGAAERAKWVLDNTTACYPASHSEASGAIDKALAAVTEFKAKQ